MSRYEILRGIEKKSVKLEKDTEPVCAGITGIPEPQSDQDNRYAWSTGYAGSTGLTGAWHAGSTGYAGYVGIAGITGIPEPDASSSISWSDVSSNTINSNSFYYYGGL
jgi:hypothetical protein